MTLKPSSANCRATLAPAIPAPRTLICRGGVAARALELFARTSSPNRLARLNGRWSHLGHGETKVGEIAADLTCRRECGYRGAAATQTCNGFEDAVLPHEWIFAWCETVQKPCVHGLALKLG